MKHQIIFAFSYFFMSCQTKDTYSDVWIDKNENENYTARHECSFVQAGDEFIMFGGREFAKKLDKYNYIFFLYNYIFLLSNFIFLLSNFIFFRQKIRQPKIKLDNYLYKFTQ